MPRGKINLIIFSLTIFLSLILVNLMVEINFATFKIEITSTLLGKEATAQEVKWTNYTVDNGIDSQLTIAVPPGWQITDDEKNGSQQTANTVVFVSPKENSKDFFQENIVLSIKAFKNSIASNETVNTQDIIEKLRNQYTMFAYENTSKTKIDNFRNLGDGIVYEFEDSGLLFKTKQVFLTEDNSIYIFSLLADQKEYNKYVLIFDQVLKSIHSSKQ